MMGTVASCKRNQAFTVNSIRRIMTPPFPIQFPNIRLLFSEENFNVNNYQQTNAQVNISMPELVMERILYSNLVTTNPLVLSNSKIYIKNIVLTNLDNSISTITLAIFRASTGRNHLIARNLELHPNIPLYITDLVLETNDVLIHNGFVGQINMLIIGRGQ